MTSHPAAESHHRFNFEAIREDRPGAKWQRLFHRLWPAYQRWYLAEGPAARPNLAQCRRALRTHMPELLPIYDRLTEMAGGSDLVARFLSLYNPPAYLASCSQAVWTKGGEPWLIRNYDYAPKLCEGVMLETRWSGKRVIAMSDCIWGALDGMNEAGLAASITFGGRRVVGDGFGIPIIIRYILEFCTTTAEAAEVLGRVPTHMAYNVTVLDRSGAYVTALLAPDRAPLLLQMPVATNHQGDVEWHDYARATATVERERFLQMRLALPETTPEKLADAFLEPPLHTTAYHNGIGTIYTAVYRPAAGEVVLRWPGRTWRQSFGAFTEGHKHVAFEAAANT